MQHGYGEGGHYIEKRRKIKTERVTQVDHPNNWRRTREDIVMKRQQRSLAVTN